MTITKTAELQLTRIFPVAIILNDIDGQSYAHPFFSDKNHKIQFMKINMPVTNVEYSFKELSIGFTTQTQNREAVYYSNTDVQRLFVQWCFYAQLGVAVIK